MEEILTKESTKENATYLPGKSPTSHKKFMNKLELAKRINRIKKLKRTEILKIYILLLLLRIKF